MYYVHVNVGRLRSYNIFALKCTVTSWLCFQQEEEMQNLQKRIQQLEGDLDQAQTQLDEATQKLENTEKQLANVSPL